MEVDIQKLLAENPVSLLFTVIGIGYLMGKIRLGRIEIGSTVGVLIAGLLFGHLGFMVWAGVATFGFTLFIFSMGLQAGPSFLTAFLADGRRYIALALIVAVTGVALALAYR